MSEEIEEISVEEAQALLDSGEGSLDEISQEEAQSLLDSGEGSLDVEKTVPEGSVKETINGVEFNVIDPDKDKPTAAESFRLGAAQGLASEFIDEAVALKETMMDPGVELSSVLNDPSKAITEVVATYNNNKDDISDTFDYINKENPGSAFAGKMAGTLGQTAAIGLYSKAVQLLKGQVALGALEGTGQAELRKGEISPILTSTGGALAGGVIGKKIGSTIANRKLAGKQAKLSKLYEERALSFKKTFGVVGAEDKFDDLLSRLGENQDEFIERVLKKVPVEDAKNPLAVKSILLEAKKDAWENGMKKELAAIDEAIGPFINSSEVKSTLLSETLNNKTLLRVEEINALKQAGNIQLADEMQGLVSQSVKKIDKLIPDEKMITASEAQSLLLKIKGLSGINKQGRETLDAALREKIMDAAEASGLDASKKFMETKKDYGAIAEMSKTVGKEVNKFSVAMDKWGVNNASYWANFKNKIGSSTNPFNSITNIGKALINYNPRPEFTSVARLANSQGAIDVTGESIRQIGDAVLNNPEKYGKLAQKVAVSAGIGIDDFMSDLGVLGSHVKLDNAPIQRNAGSIDEAKPDILNIARSLDPMMAKNLQHAYSVGDQETINSIITTAAYMPEFAGKIDKNTLGIDGVIYSPIEFEMASQSIKDAYKDGIIGTTQKLLLETDLDKKGGSKVPFMTEEPDFISIKELNKRNKEGKKGTDF